MSRIITVCCASQNLDKIEGCRNAYEALFPDCSVKIEGMNAESGVSDLPLGEEACISGAINRAVLIKELNPDFEYWVGIEAGLRVIMDSFWAMTSYSSILTKAGETFIGSSSSHLMFRKDKTTGPFDIIKKLNQYNGRSIDHITNGAYTRREKCYEAVICALSTQVALFDTCPKS